MTDFFLASFGHFFEKVRQMVGMMSIMQIFALPGDIQAPRTLTFMGSVTYGIDNSFKHSMRNSRILFGLFLLFSIAMLAPACSKKSGCPATETLKPKMDKKGGFKKSSGSSSGLFPKKMRKKMK